MQYNKFWRIKVDIQNNYTMLMLSRVHLTISFLYKETKCFVAQTRIPLLNKTDCLYLFAKIRKHAYFK